MRALPLNFKYYSGKVWAYNFPKANFNLRGSSRTAHEKTQEHYTKKAH